MKKEGNVFISLLLVIAFFVTFYYAITMGPTLGIKEFYGEYVSISGITNAAYSKDYVMMDCCREWNDVVVFANMIPNASYAEAFEFYLFDKNDNKVNTALPLTITVAPSERLAGENAYVYFLNDLTDPIKTEYVDGKYTFETNRTGIFLLVKMGTNTKSVYIRNDDDCHGQCRECSAY